MRLRAILDQRDAALARDAGERVDVGNASIEMGDDHRARSRTEPRGERGRVHQQRRRVDLDVGGHRARGADRRRRVHPGIRRGRDLVARTDRERAQRELERIRAVADGDALGGPAVRREFALEGLDLRAEDVPAAIVDARNRRVELGAQRRVVARQIVQRDHARQPALSSARAHTSFQSRKPGAKASGRRTSLLLRGLQQK